MPVRNGHRALRAEANFASHCMLSRSELEDMAKGASKQFHDAIRQQKKNTGMNF